MTKNCLPVPLQVTTHYSFLRGASYPSELFTTAAAMGYKAMGIADYQTVAGLVQAQCAAREAGIRLIPGCRLQLTDGTVLLAYPKDRTAWARLCFWLTLGHKRGTRETFALDWHDLAHPTPPANPAAPPTHPVAAGAAGTHGHNDNPADAAQHQTNTDQTYPDDSGGFCFILVPTPRPYRSPRDTVEDAAICVSQLHQMKAILGQKDTPHHLFLALTRHFHGGDGYRLAMLADMAQRTQIPLIAADDVMYHIAERHILYDTLTAIRERKPLEQLGARRDPLRDRHLRSPVEMHQLYAHDPDALRRTQDIASLCHFSLDDLKYQYPQESDIPGETPQQTLERLVTAAIPQCYPYGAPKEVCQQITHELALIARLDYAPYFLTVNTIVQFARSRGIVCQGRGSAANSAICYVLGITSIDPVQSGLLFERFVSAERREPPDIDVDFESDRREEVIQWIYHRYGRGHAALCATIHRYRAKGALRDVGKAMGLSTDLLSLLSTHLASALGDDALFRSRSAEMGLDLSDRRIALTVHLARQILGFPRQLGTHPGGFVLTHDRLDGLVPIQPAAMNDRQIIVWDKDDIDQLRFMKVDILGLGMLGCIRRCFETLAAHRHLRLDMANIPAEDKPTYAMIRKADTLGTFQVESRAQMSMLPRLKPTTFYDLVVQVAIVRPGPIQGDMVHPYLRRREGLEEATCVSPTLEAILGKTLGVPLFQEQAMQIAIQCAGFTPGEADALRRAMATFKFTGGVSHFRDKLVRGMIERGYDPSFAERVFSQLEGFGSYGFPESHAASFARIAYISCYLKYHHPDMFCAALLNSQPMGFYAPAQIVRDAREHGVEVRPVDINYSQWDCTLEGRPGGRRHAVRLGMRLVKALAHDDAARLIARRVPLYENITDVWHRADVPLAALEHLAQADAFRHFGVDRRQALWDIKGLRDRPLPLFAASSHTRNRPEVACIEPPVTLPPIPPQRDVHADYHTTSLSLKAHPFAFIRPTLTKRRVLPCGALTERRDGQRVSIAGLVLMRQRPGTAKGVMFITIEDETGFANLILWKNRIEAQRAIVIAAGALICHGILQREGEVTHIVVERLEDAGPLLRPELEDGEIQTAPLKPRVRNFQ